jgi:hypothetical protein
MTFDMENTPTNGQIADQAQDIPAPVTPAQPEKSCPGHPELSTKTHEAYGLGFNQGLIASEFTANETNIVSSIEVNRTIHLLRVCCEEIFHLESKLKEGKTRLRQLKEQITGNQEHNKVLENKEGFLVEKTRYLREEIEATTATIVSIRPIIGLWIALLYVVVGFAFVYTDFEINRQIFRDILDMNLMESTIFAAGVALIAFMLKPAVDRVFEKEYPHKAEVIARNHWLLLIVGGLALLALALLGLFRGLNLNVLVTGDYEAGPTGMTLMTIGLLLFTVLFAIAGAISFSIGSPVVRAYLTLMTYRIYRRRKRVALKRTTDKIHRLQKKAGERRSSIAVDSEEAAELEQTLAVTAQVLAEKKQTEQDLIAAYYEALTATDKAAYQAGYENGQRYTLNHPLEASVRPFKKRYYYWVKEKGAGAPEDPAKYIHQKLRREIKNRLNHIN